MFQFYFTVGLLGALLNTPSLSLADSAKDQADRPINCDPGTPLFGTNACLGKETTNDAAGTDLLGGQAKNLKLIEAILKMAADKNVPATPPPTSDENSVWPTAVSALPLWLNTNTPPVTDVQYPLVPKNSSTK